MEHLLRKECEKHGVPFDALTESEREQLEKEIFARRSGKAVLDGVLSSTRLKMLKLKS